MESTKETNFKKIRKKIFKKNKEMFSELKKIIMFSKDEHIIYNENTNFAHIPLGIDNHSLIFYKDFAFLMFPINSVIDSCFYEDYRDSCLIKKSFKTGDITYGFFAFFSEDLDFDSTEFFNSFDKNLKSLSSYWDDIFFCETFEIMEFYPSLFFYDMFKMLSSNLDSIESSIFKYIVSLETAMSVKLKTLMKKHSELFEKDIEVDKKEKINVPFPFATKI